MVVVVVTGGRLPRRYIHGHCGRLGVTRVLEEKGEAAWGVGVTKLPWTKCGCQ